MERFIGGSTQLKEFAAEGGRVTNNAGMKRPVTSEKILAAYRIICEHPNGISKWDLIKKLDIRNSHIDGILASLEGTDMLISEDAGWYFEYKHEEYENISVLDKRQSLI